MYHIDYHALTLPTSNDLYYWLGRNKDSKAASEVFARSQKAWVPLDDLYISSLKLFETLLKSESKPIPFEVRAQCLGLRISL